MAGDIETSGVNDMTERIEIAPSGDGELVTGPEDTDPDSPQGNDGEDDADGDVDPENDPADAAPDGKPESIRPTATPAADAASDDSDPSNADGLRRLSDETPREFARRLEINKLRGQLRIQRTGEILETVQPVSEAAPAANPAMEAVLSKYKPEELAALREVLPAIAGELGFVRKDELEGTSYKDKVQDELDSFMDRHPEYKPENDKDGTLWDAFKSEHAIYRQPANPKDYRRIFEKVHQTVFGIQAGTPLPKVEAQQRKVQVAGHAGTSGPSAPTRTQRNSGASSGLRLDALKGFDDETKQRIAARAGGE